MEFTHRKTPNYFSVDSRHEEAEISSHFLIYYACFSFLDFAFATAIIIMVQALGSGIRNHEHKVRTTVSLCPQDYLVIFGHLHNSPDKKASDSQTKKKNFSRTFGRYHLSFFFFFFFKIEQRC